MVAVVGVIKVMSMMSVMSIMGIAVAVVAVVVRGEILCFAGGRQKTNRHDEAEADENESEFHFVDFERLTPLRQCELKRQLPLFKRSFSNSFPLVSNEND